MTFKMPETEYEHPSSATKGNKGNPSDVSLIYQDRHISGKFSKPSVGKKSVQRSRMLPPVLTATAIQGIVGVQMAYDSVAGVGKPSAVLEFEKIDVGDADVWFRFKIKAGVRIEVRWLENGDWQAALVKHKMIANRHGVHEKSVKLIKARPMENPTFAALELFKREGWFYHAGAWRSLRWLYRSVIVCGLGKDAQLPKKCVYGLKADHVPGMWAWDQAITPVPVFVELPDNKGIERFGLKGEREYVENGHTTYESQMPDIRSELSFEQNGDKNGRLVKMYVNGKKVWKAPENAAIPAKLAYVPQSGSALDPHQSQYLESGNII